MLAERLNRLKPREKFGLLVAVLVLVILLLDRVSIRPLGEKCAGLDVDIAREQKARDYQASVLAARDAVEQRYAALRARLGDPLPTAEAIDAMKGEIDALARDADVTLRAMKHREPRKLAHYEEYTVDIGDFESDENGLLRFLHALMATPGTFQVTKLKLAPDSTGKRVKGSMTVTKIAVPAGAAAARAP